jgi:hypothetical protein
MKRIVKFKKFESQTHQIEKSDLEEIFIDLIDDDYLLTVYGEGKLDKLHPGTYYFDLRKQFSEQFDFDTKTLSYGCRDLDSMQTEIKKVFDSLKVAKDRINSMGYDIGFEPEFAFSEDTLFCITCHMSHSSDEDVNDDY